jgi:ABC-type branched-subunit amino acid transport system permease subunit
VIHVFGLEISTFDLIRGGLTGVTYGLLALGLVLIYKSSRVLNFAHGQLGVIASILLAKLVNDIGIPYWVTLPVVLLVAVGVGAGSELLLRRLFTRPRLLLMVATIGLSQVLFVLGLWPALQPEKNATRFPIPIHVKWHVGNYVVTGADVTVLVFAPLLALGLALFFQLTPYGLAVRAAAENAESARLGGIWVRRTSTIAWMIAGLLSAFTAILSGPYKPNEYTLALGPFLVVRALTAGLLSGMSDLRIAFLAGIGVGVVEQVAASNAPFDNPGVVELVMFGLLLLALMLRGRALRTTLRTEERSSWQQGAATRLRTLATDRRRVGQAGTLLTALLLLLAPAVLSYSRAFLFSRIFIYAVLALSLTLLSGWAGQLSLGHFGLAAVGAVVAARAPGLPLPVVLLIGGAVAAVVSLVVGLPALRIKGLYLALTTLAFAVLVSTYLLKEPSFGLPEPANQVVPYPRLFGIDFAAGKSFYYLCLAVLVLAIVTVSNLRRSAVGRALIAVRDNEAGAAAAGVRIVPTKLTAFAISGFLAGIAGVLFAWATHRFTVDYFDAYESIVVVSMVVIGGIGSVRGALLGATYLLGLPALFGYSRVVEFVTSGVGLLVFVLYLPGGLVGLLDRLGDTVTSWVRAMVAAQSPPTDLQQTAEVAP